MNTELGDVQAQFADLIWAYAPIPSGELVKLCEREFHWKKPTTYTVLRKLCEKGLFENSGGLVKAKVSRETFYCQKGEQIIRDSFSGSLPAFLAAFTARKPLTDAEAAEIMQIIQAYRTKNGV